MQKYVLIYACSFKKGGWKMTLQKTAKVQVSKTNVTINIPIEQREALGIAGGDTVLLTADTNKKEIIIKKVGG